VIEPGVAATWPEEVKEALQRFLQGHLIELPPLFYGANLDYPIWSLSSVLDESDEVPDEERRDTIADLAHDQRPPYGILLTQTCDLAEERPNPRQPWVQIAPVYRFDRESSLLAREYVHELDPPTIPGEVWAADLRIEVPLEKSVLVGRQPIEAFPDEAGYVDFASVLARRRGRPAFSSVVHEVVTVTMRRLKEESNSRRQQARRVRERVYKLMIAIQDGTRLHPNAVQVHLVLKGERDEDTENWFDEWWDRARTVAEAHGLQLLETVWLDARGVDATLYDELVEVRLPI
jgi:hypothetical protein